MGQWARQASWCRLQPHHAQTPPCSDPDCKGNYIRYYKDRHGQKAEFVFNHLKNDAIKGPQRVPISANALELLIRLERAVAAQPNPPDCLFFNISGQMYSDTYFHTRSGDLLTPAGADRVTAEEERQAEPRC